MHEIKVHCTLKVHGAKQWILYITYVQITVHAPGVVYTGKNVQPLMKNIEDMH